MKAKIHVYECEEAESKAGNTYYKVFGRIGGAVTTWMSKISLVQGTQDIELDFSEYKGDVKIWIIG